MENSDEAYARYWEKSQSLLKLLNSKMITITEYDNQIEVLKKYLQNEKLGGKINIFHDEYEHCFSKPNTACSNNYSASIESPHVTKTTMLSAIKAIMFNRLVLYVLFACIAYKVGLFINDFSFSSPKSPEEQAKISADNDRDDAKISAKLAVQASLKSPTSASWPSYNEIEAAPIAGQPDAWGVYGYVDAQNSYGVMLRTKWHVKVKKDGKSWQLLDINTY